MSRIRRSEVDEWTERRASQLGPSRKVWKNLKQSEQPHCQVCGRETEYLFDGFMPAEPPDPKTLARFKGNLQLAVALSSPFMAQPAQVCLQCRPPSNLEIQELVRDSSQAEQARRRAMHPKM